MKKTGSILETSVLMALCISLTACAGTATGADAQAQTNSEMMEEQTAQTEERKAEYEVTEAKQEVPDEEMTEKEDHEQESTGSSAAEGNANVDDSENMDEAENVTGGTEAMTDEQMAGIGETAALETTIYQVNGVEFKMILVEAGTFTMGSDNSNVAFSESPAHQVTLTQDYLMGETEVTEALWNAVMGSGGGSETMPKTSVTWNSAHDFVNQLNAIAHEQGMIAEDVNFHLPTEAQWEFAAKGGNLSQGYLYSGSNDIDEVAVTRENSGSDSPIEVRTKAPNELGLYDMSGNAYEWVDDYAGEYSSEAQTDPQNTTPSNSYVKRGGSNYHGFNSEDYLFTTTGRYFYGGTDWTIGFRICLY